MRKTSILVTDDDPAIQKLLNRGLTGYGYNVIAVSNGQEALDIVAQKPPDIIVLDIHLESQPDGLEICRQIREWSKLPIIMLTAHDEKRMKLSALNAGADDYITKPFDLEELEARIRTVLRRSAYENTPFSSGAIRIHDLKIDLINRRVALGSDEVHLTRKEYDLLKLLAINPGKVLTFEMLLQHVWGSLDSAMPEHNVRVYINMLRKKLKDDPATVIKPRYIFNEPGIGYRFADLEATGITEKAE